MKNEKKVLFPFGKLRNKNKAVLYCGLHKCFMSKGDLIAKKFKCNKCKHFVPLEYGNGQTLEDGNN